MTYVKPLFIKIFLSAITVIEALAGVLSNASILLLIARFKSLRTVCNLLLANLAAVDMLNAAINMPIHLLYTVLEPRLFRGPISAFLITFLQRVFTLLNLASMLVLLANMYFGIAFNLKYYVWKSNRKAVLCCFLVWLTCTALAQLSCLPIQSIDLGDSPVARYRAEIFKQGKHHFIAVALFFLFGGIVFLVLIVCSIRRSRKKVVKVMNLTDLQAKARMRNDLHSTKTIALTMAAFFLCYLPVLFYALVARLDGSKANFWFSYVSWLVHCFATIVNPVIYYTRANRFRFALKQFLKDLFGTEDLTQLAFLNNPKRRMQFNLTNTTSHIYHSYRRNATVFMASGANESCEEAKEERVIISPVPSSKAASQIVVGERGDASSNFHRTQTFQDSSCKKVNIGITTEEPFYKLKRRVDCQSVTESNERQRGILAKRRNGISPGAS